MRHDVPMLVSSIVTRSSPCRGAATKRRRFAVPSETESSTLCHPHVPLSRFAAAGV
jgi:hypothetical protein